MNLFVLAYSEHGHGESPILRQTLTDLTRDLPFFPGEKVASWVAPSRSFACAWIAHGPARVGGIRYVCGDDTRLALYVGRPILWHSDKADGRTPLDPRFYLDATDDSLLALDGRFAAARYNDATRALDLVTDPLGAYPLFETAFRGTRLISNNAEILRRLRGSRAPSLVAAAGLVAGGWPLNGDPLWETVTRVQGAGVHAIRGNRRSLRPSFDQDDPEVVFGSTFEPSQAAALLVQNIRALADWPGRPSIVGVTAGRDSRLVLGAIVAAGVQACLLTGGQPDDADVRVGRLLAKAVGLPHVVDSTHIDPRLTDWRRTARVVDLMASGTVSLADAHGYKLDAPVGPLSLWHSGQGGEIARGYYGTGARLDAEQLTRSLYRKFCRIRPGVAPPLSAEGERLVKGQIRNWVEQQVASGFSPEDVPDLFYLKKRMGTWAGPGHGCAEYVRDTTSPLWSHRVVPLELGLPSRQRVRELFHLTVLAQLEPRLVEVPFERGNGWPSRRSPLRTRLQPLVHVLLELPDDLRRRAAALVPRNGNTVMARALPGIRDVVLSEQHHPAWTVLDRPHVERLLRAEPDSLDFVRTTYVWNVATVFTAGLSTP
ncbi:MAG TPA: hypothetical protein VFA19_02900 [Gaiellaceae bacterium]|nr:hypothetical protein [Gaiellaceae bacterium]